MALTLEQQKGKVLKNLVKRTPRTAAELAERLGYSRGTAVSAALGSLIDNGEIAVASKNPTGYVRVS